MKRIKGQLVNVPGYNGARINGTIISGPHFLIPGVSFYRVHSGLVIHEVQSRRIRTGRIAKQEQIA